MLKKKYGKTYKHISAVSFGAMRFSDPHDIDAMAEIVMHAYDRGINYFDTAPLYCESKSEQIVGAAIKQMKPGSFYVSTKCNSPDGDELRKSLEASLKLLNVEKIDFFHIWCIITLDAWRQRLEGGAVAAALKAKEEGLIEHVVVSSHLPGDELAQVLDEGPFDGVTLGYCAINFPYRQAALDAASRLNLGVITMNPLGGGLIPQNAERFDFLREPGDKSVVQAALRFNVSNPAVTSALVGFSTKQQVDEAIEAIENFHPYSSEKISTIRSKIMESFDGLCTGCGYCLPCPAGIKIPSMMDAYNFKILGDGSGEQNITNRLKWHWGLTPEAARACEQCGLCEQRCTQHLPIQERMAEIADLTNEADNG